MKKLIVVVMAMMFTVGCATIIGDKIQLMPISSNLGGAKVSITDEKGNNVFKGETPTTVTLHKSDGSYWGGKSYVVKISKGGFESHSISVTSHPNGWYLAGNLVFGGLIGWFIVDPLNGAMYTLKPEQVSATMDGKSSKLDGNKIHIVLINDVPLSLRSKMKIIN